MMLPLSISHKNLKQAGQGSEESSHKNKTSIKNGFKGECQILTNLYNLRRDKVITFEPQPQVGRIFAAAKPCRFPILLA